MSEDQGPLLLKVHPRVHAGREPLKSYCQAVIEIWMGPLCFNHMCVVADVVDEVLLGEDLFLYDSSGPADSIQSEEKNDA